MEKESNTNFSVLRERVKSCLFLFGHFHIVLILTARPLHQWKLACTIKFCSSYKKGRIVSCWMGFGAWKAIECMKTFQLTWLFSWFLSWGTFLSSWGDDPASVLKVLNCKRMFVNPWVGVATVASSKVWAEYSPVPLLGQYIIRPTR